MKHYNNNHPNQTASPKTPRGAAETSPTHITLRHGRKKPLKIPIDDFTDATLADVEQQLAGATLQVTADITSVSRWPEAKRKMILPFFSRMQGSITFVVSGNTFSDLFAAVLAAMPGTDDLTAHAAGLRAMKEVAAMLDPGISASAAAMINDTLRRVGAAPIHPARLTKEIQELAGAGGSPDGSRAEAHRLAGCFIAELRTQSGLTGDDQPLFVYHRDNFFRFECTHWRHIEDRCLQSQVTGMLQRQSAGDITTKLIGNIVENLKGMALLPQWDVEPPFHFSSLASPVIAKKNWLSCKNGLLDLDDVMLGDSFVGPLSAMDSRFFTLNVLPFEYDQSSTCPRWLQFLHQVLPRVDQHDHRQDVLQEFMGYSLLFDTRFEKFLVLYGPAQAGKSTVMRVWESMLGAGNVSHVPFDQLGGEFRLHSLSGKMVNFCSDLDHLGRAREGLIKQLVSGEVINVNRKYKAPVDVHLTAKHVVGCNELPTIADTSQGMWRRLIVIPFLDVIPQDQINCTLSAELVAELPGIFNWACAGLGRLLANNRFTTCPRCQAVVDEHQINSDSVKDFVEACIRRCPHADANSQYLYEVYNYFAKERGRHPVSAPQFGMRMKAQGYSKRRAGAAEIPTRPYLYNNIALTGEGAEWRQRYMSAKSPGWTDVTVPHPPAAPEPVQADPQDPDHVTPEEGTV